MGNKNNNKKSKNILEFIKSQYILKNIFDYIKDDNFKYKIFVHSKKLQNKIGLNSIQYHIKYLERFNLDPLKFLSFNNCNSDIRFGQNIIKKSLSEYLSNNKIENDIFQAYSKNYFMNYIENDENDNYFYIDIFSPIFDTLITSKEICEKMFIILKMFEIKKYGLEHQYISTFQNLKNLKNYYSLSIEFSFDYEIKYLDELNIDFSYLKKLELNFGYEINKTQLQKILFSNKILEKNLQYLDSKLFENINNFQSLTELNLERIKFDEVITLDLPYLLKLSISFCNNISLSEKLALIMKKISFYKFSLIKISALYKFSKLEECRCDIGFLELIDTSSLINLKKLTIDAQSDVRLCDIQAKMPKLLSLNINIDDSEANINNLEIKENNNTNIKELSLVINKCFPNVLFCINKFENLSVFKFINYSNISTEKYFPFFEINCLITFNYLTIFEFCTFKNRNDYNIIDIGNIKNLYGNLNQFINLKCFKFISVSRFIKLDFYIEFIKNLLFLNIKEIELDLKDEFKSYDKIDDKYYIEEELKMIYSSINFVKCKKIRIKKLNGIPK